MEPILPMHSVSPPVISVPEWEQVPVVDSRAAMTSMEVVRSEE